MPYYMHQWTYKDPQTRSMVKLVQNRGEIIRVAVEAFGGKLHHFFFAFGKWDGVAITEFDDNETALACLMSVVGQGALASVETTVLITQGQSQAAMKMANEIVTGYRPPSENER